MVIIFYSMDIADRRQFPGDHYGTGTKFLLIPLLYANALSVDLFSGKL